MQRFLSLSITQENKENQQKTNYIELYTVLTIEVWEVRQWSH